MIENPALETKMDGLAVEVAERYRSRLVIFAMRRLSDRMLAEEAAQETLRRVTEALDAGRVNDLAALPGFVFQTARHVCQHVWRKAGREQRALRTLSNQESQVEASDATNPLTALITEERRAAVRRALAALDTQDRNILEWLYGQGVEIREIGRWLGMTPGAVRVRKHRALKRLAAFLETGETN